MDTLYQTKSSLKHVGEQVITAQPGKREGVLNLLQEFRQEAKASLVVYGDDKNRDVVRVVGLNPTTLGDLTKKVDHSGHICKTFLPASSHKSLGKRTVLKL